MLISLKVEKLVIAAVPELVGTWTASFGFIPMEDAEKISFRKINLMVFPGTIMLKKTLYISHPAAVPQGQVHCILICFYLLFIIKEYYGGHWLKLSLLIQGLMIYCHRKMMSHLRWWFARKGNLMQEP